MKRALFAAALVLLSAPAAAETRVMTLDDCVALAARKNPDVVTSELDVTGAEASRAQVRGEFFPKVRAEGNVTQWDRPFDIDFGGAKFRVRDAFTWTGIVSVVQPLSGLFAIYDAYHARDLGVDVARLRRDVAKRDVAFHVAEAYVQVLEAGRLAEIAGASVAQLEAQRRQAESLYTNGVIGKNDLLRAELALASARERAIDAQGQLVIAQGRLGTLVGLSTDAAITPAPLAGDPPPPEEATLGGAEAHALAQRLELHELDARIEQSDARVRLAGARLFPEISAVGNYTHFVGSEFQQRDAAYAGVNASWNVWDWGTTWNGIEEAKARRQQAEVLKTKVKDELRLEARQAFVRVEVARTALAVARTAVGQAEENYRIVTKRFAANTATSFDVVDAEALLTQSRARVETALYGYHAARFALQRAVGDATPRVR
jgi:outer membrane protein